MHLAAKGKSKQRGALEPLESLNAVYFPRTLKQRPIGTGVDLGVQTRSRKAKIKQKKIGATCDVSLRIIGLSTLYYANHSSSSKTSKRRICLA